jgi:DNA modification methylase
MAQVESIETPVGPIEIVPDNASAEDIADSVECLDAASGKDWTLFRGDCCEITKGFPDNSIDLIVHSPPFSNLYVYSDSEADMGNNDSDEAFFEHYRFLVKELYRITTPGRLCVIHCKDLPAYFGRDDYAGLRPFPDQCKKVFMEEGWQSHSLVTIWKCPVIERARTNSYGLLHQQLCKDSAASRQGMPDYLVVMRKWDGLSPMEFPKPVRHPVGGSAESPWRFDGFVGEEPPDMVRTEDNARDYSIQVWQRYASPVWFDVNQTNVLSYEQSRDDKDERHICPLQMDVVERCVDLWSNPGDVVFDPFNGIGSTGVGALKHGRKYVGTELKESYFRVACRMLAGEENRGKQKSLFGDDQ